MRIVLVLLSVCCVLGCNSKVEPASNTTKVQDPDAKKITVKDIKGLKYTDYVLGQDSKKALSEWLNYQELMAQIDFLKKGDLSFFNGKNELLQNFISDLKTTLPKAVATPSITARLSALETKLLKLHSTLKLDYFNKEDVLNDIKEFLITVSNLHLQINKKFEKESQIIETPY